MGKYALRSSTNDTLLNPVSFKTYCPLGDRSFMVAAPKLWNALPLSIASSSRIDIFKKKLKTFLFQRAFKPLIT